MNEVNAETSGVVESAPATGCPAAERLDGQATVYSAPPLPGCSCPSCGADTINHFGTCWTCGHCTCKLCQGSGKRSPEGRSGPGNAEAVATASTERRKH